MIKRLFVLIFLFTVFSLNAMPSGYPFNREAPFGLEWGMSISETYNKCISMDIIITEDGSYSNTGFDYIFLIPPEPLFCFSEYSVYFSEYGLDYICAESETYALSENYGKDYITDPLKIAKDYASESVFPYSALIDWFGKPNTIIDKLIEDNKFEASWYNDLIKIDYSIGIYNNYDSVFFDKKVCLSLEYRLTQQGKELLGKNQAELLY